MGPTTWHVKFKQKYEIINENNFGWIQWDLNITILEISKFRRIWLVAKKFPLQNSKPQATLRFNGVGV
jgi:hypothetical protein